MAREQRIQLAADAWQIGCELEQSARLSTRHFGHGQGQPTDSRIAVVQEECCLEVRYSALGPPRDPKPGHGTEKATFSAFSLDVAVLYERGRLDLAGLYAVGSVVCSLAALFLALRWCGA